MLIYNHSSLFINYLYRVLNKLALVFVIMLIIQLYLIFTISLCFYKFEQKRNVLVSQYKQIGITDLTLPCISSYISPTVFVDDITPDKNFYNNQAYADFYGFKKLHVKQ